ncbi:hypothetical protein D9M68_794680 [compost metagenome]
MEELLQFYKAEKQWLDLLPIISSAINCEELKENLKRFYTRGKQGLEWLRSIINVEEKNLKFYENEDIVLLTDECYDIIDITPRNSFIRNSGVIISLQLIQQYLIEMCTKLLQGVVHHRETHLISGLQTILDGKKQEEEILALSGAETAIN